MQVSPRWARWLAVTLLFMAGGRARAGSDTHYQDVLVGDRAAGMGGAFTALSGEAAAAYYNPAGIIADASTAIQVSMSAYKLRRKSAEVADLCGTPLSSDENAFFGFPATFGFAKQLGKGRVRHALGLTAVISSMDKTAQIYSLADVRCGPVAMGMGGSSLMVDRSLWTGVTYAVKPWPFLQAGMTLGLAMRAGSFSQLLTVVPKVQGTSYYPGVDFASGEAKLLSFFVQLGVIVEPLPGLRLGLSVTPPQVRLLGTGSLDVMQAAADPASWQQSFLAQLEGVEYDWRVPLQVSLGAAYTIRDRWTLSTDVRIHAGVGAYPVYAHPALASQGAVWPIPTMKRRPLANVSVGGEALLGKRWALRLGFFTNLSSVPSEQSDEQINNVGFSAGASYLASRSTYSLAVQTQFGSGRLQAQRVTWEGAGLRQETYQVGVNDYSLIVAIGGGIDLH